MLEINKELRDIVVSALRHSLEHPYTLKETIQFILSNQRMFNTDMVKKMYFISRERLKIKDLTTDLIVELEKFIGILQEWLDEN